LAKQDSLIDNPARLLDMAAQQLSTLADAIAGGDELPAVAVTGSGGAKLSRKQLRDLVESLARRLTAAGIAPGDVVSVSTANTVRSLVFSAVAWWPLVCVVREEQNRPKKAIANWSTYLLLLQPPQCYGTHTLLLPQHKQIEFLIAFLAITQARAVAAPFNAAYKQVGARRGAGGGGGPDRLRTCAPPSNPNC
jgi:acyl-CoA synthetase (AMP-forming)/AMP-acid ligase II